MDSFLKITLPTEFQWIEFNFRPFENRSKKDPPQLLGSDHDAIKIYPEFKSKSFREDNRWLEFDSSIQIIKENINIWNESCKKIYKMRKTL